MRQHIIPLLLIAVLLLAGCFRQADEPFEPAEDAGNSGAVEENLGDDENDPAPTNTASSMADGPSATPTIQVIVSTPITLPDDETTATPDAESDITTTPTPTRLRPGQPPGPIETNTPEPTATGGATATPSGLITPTDISDDGGAAIDDDCIYIVQNGDTLFAIARRFDTTVAAIREVNPDLVGDTIFPGDEIILPDCEPGAPAVSGPTATAPAPGAAPPSTGPTATPQQVIHIVQAGETLTSIAARYGVTVLQITQANGLTNPNALSVGQELIIPLPPEGS